MKENNATNKYQYLKNTVNQKIQIFQYVITKLNYSTVKTKRKMLNILNNGQCTKKCKKYINK